MENSASVISRPSRSTAPTSLVQALFGDVGEFVTIIPSTGSQVRCNHCERVVLSVVGDAITVLHRHDGKPHKTVIALSDLGLVRAC